MDIEKILEWGYPGRQWSMTDNKYETLIFYDTGAIPTLQELEIQNALYLKHISDTEYLRLREKQYPSHEDKMDALWKRIMNSDPIDSDSLKSQIDNIDKQYPPPSLS